MSATVAVSLWSEGDVYISALWSGKALVSEGIEKDTLTVWEAAAGMTGMHIAATRVPAAIMKWRI